MSSFFVFLYIIQIYTIMKAKELAKLLMKTPEREVYAIDYECKDYDDLIALEHVFQEESDDKVVLSFSNKI